MQKKKLLLFFRKIKHEFLHIVRRFLEIRYLGTFTQVFVPEKYTPINQLDPRNPVANVGDHDEEEDSGGLILPHYNDQKLSGNNPLCLQHHNKFLLLSTPRLMVYEI